MFFDLKKVPTIPFMPSLNTSHSAVSHQTQIRSADMHNRGFPHPFTAWSHGASKPPRTKTKWNIRKVFIWYTQHCQNESCEKFKTAGSSVCIANMPLNGTIHATLTTDLQSVVSTLTFGLPFTMWTNCNHNIFFSQGRNTPTCVFLTKSSSELLWSVTMTHLGNLH